MIQPPDNYLKDTKDLCLPFIKLKDLSEKDIKKRRDHILSRLLDEERIRKDKELKKQRMLKEKEENSKILSNFIWDKDFINLPPICTNRLTFPKTKSYLTLFDESCYRFPLSESKYKKKDPLLRFNSKATIVEVEKDFHPNYDCATYRRYLENQMKINSKSKEENKNLEIKLDKFTIQNYPFGESQFSNNQQDRFPRYKIPIELGELDDKFFPWCTSFGEKMTIKRQKDAQIEPIICRTKSSYVKI